MSSRDMDLENFTNACITEEGETPDRQTAKDIRMIYELTKRSFPSLSVNQATMIYRVYKTGVQTGEGLGVESD